MDDNNILRVKGGTSAPALASTISFLVCEGKPVTLRAIGAAAVNQAVKAVAISQGQVGSKGLTLSMRPGFSDVEMPEGTVTAMTFKVFSE